MTLNFIQKIHTCYMLHVVCCMISTLLYNHDNSHTLNNTYALIHTHTHTRIVHSPIHNIIDIQEKIFKSTSNKCKVVPSHTTYKIFTQPTHTHRMPFIHIIQTLITHYTITVIVKAHQLIFNNSRTFTHIFHMCHCVILVIHHNHSRRCTNTHKKHTTAEAHTNIHTSKRARTHTKHRSTHIQIHTEAQTHAQTHKQTQKHTDTHTHNIGNRHSKNN